MAVAKTAEAAVAMEVMVSLRNFSRKKVEAVVMEATAVTVRAVEAAMARVETGEAAAAVVTEDHLHSRIQTF